MEDRKNTVGTDGTNTHYDVLAIPDRIRRDEQGKEYLELSLMLTPAWDPEGPLSLPDWPENIFDMVSKSALVSFKSKYMTVPVTVEATSRINDYLVSLTRDTEKISEELKPKDLWQKVFTEELEDRNNWQHLQDALENIVNPPSASPSSKSTTLKPTDFETGYIDQFFERIEYEVRERRTMGDDISAGERNAKEILSKVKAIVFAPDRATINADFHDETNVSRLNPWECLDALFQPLTTTEEKDYDAKYRAEIDSMAFQLSREIPDLGEFPDNPKKKEELDKKYKKESEFALAKLMSLKALPSISHYVGLGVQLSIDLEEIRKKLPIKGRQVMEVTAALGGIDPIKSTPTVVTIALDDNPEFEVAQDGRDDPVFSSWNGVLVNDSYTAPRYWISERDAVNGLMNALMLVDNEEEFEKWFKNFKAKSKGISLIDRKTNASLAQELATQGTGAPEKYFGEDLTVGVRPDIGIVVPSDDGSTNEILWCPTTQREIRCAEIDKTFFDLPAVKELSYRDHGFSFAPEKEEKKEDGKSEVSRHNEVFTWQGESLALSRSLIGGMLINPREMLNLNLSYNVAEDAIDSEFAQLLPPLRTGLRYVVGCRIVLQNGAGLRESKYTENVEGKACIFGTHPKFNKTVQCHVAGRTSSVTPLCFHGMVSPAPSIHIKDGTDFATRKGETHGDRVDQMIIRSHGGHEQKAGREIEERQLTAPRISFDDAELQGQFDDDGVPRSAYPKLIKSPETGTFPEVRSGEQYWWRRDDKQETYLARINSEDRVDLKDVTGSRGTVLRQGKVDEDIQFFVHKEARCLRRLGGDEADYLQFWQADEVPSDAIIANLLLECSEDAPGVTFDDVGHSVKITLPMASKAEHKFFVASDKGATDAKNSLEVRFIHAVRKPLQKPEFYRKEEEQADKENQVDVGLYAVTIDETSPIDRKDLNGKHSKNYHSSISAWQQFVEANKQTHPKCWQGHVGGATTYFVGNVGIHRPSTGSISAMATWQEYNLQTIRRGRKGNWELKPRKVKDTLFKTQINEEDGAQDKLDKIDLLYGEGKAETDNLRSLNYQFRDRRARKLNVEIEAVSAYRQYFPGSKDEKKVREFSETSGTTHIWVKSTVRPLPPALDRTLPVFNWRIGSSSPYEKSVKRTVSYRIYLKDWYSSGEGERLAIVMLPRLSAEDEGQVGDLPKTRLETQPDSVCDYGVAEAFIEFMPRFSRDAALGSGPQPFIVEPYHFSRTDDDLVKNVTLFLGENRDEKITGLQFTSSGESMQVSILPLGDKSEDFKPTIDPVHGPFYELSLPSDHPDWQALDYWPFLLLSVVRYQPQSVGNLQLSHPTQLQLQRLPKRELIVTKGDEKKYRLRVIGDRPEVSFPNASFDEDSAKLQSLELYAHVMSYDQSDSAWDIHSSKKVELTNGLKEDQVLYDYEFDANIFNSAVMVEEFEKYSSGSKRLVFSTMVRL